MSSSTVLLAGATGMLGARIAYHLSETEGVALRMLVRPTTLADPDKRSGLDSLVERGAELVEAMAAMYGTYQLFMLTGQTALEDLQNDRYPDIEPVTLEQLSAEEFA